MRVNGMRSVKVLCAAFAEIFHIFMLIAVESAWRNLNQGICCSGGEARAKLKALHGFWRSLAVW